MFPIKSKVELFSPSGAVIEPEALDRGIASLKEFGFEVQESELLRARAMRFAGDDAQRAQAIWQAFSNARSAGGLVIASRGGYGITRLLPALNWRDLVNPLHQLAKVLCGHSDVTVLQLALMQHGCAARHLLHGPMACFDFGAVGGADPSTIGHFQRAVQQGLVDVMWKEEGPDCQNEKVSPAAIEALSSETLATGPAWGGNLAMLCSLLGTPFQPQIEGGILILEDVNEPPYKIERMLLQLHQAGVLAQQKAVVLGQFGELKPHAHDDGYGLPTVVEYVRSLLNIPVLTNFPFGHCSPKACFFQGGVANLARYTAPLGAEIQHYYYRFTQQV